MTGRVKGRVVRVAGAGDSQATGSVAHMDDAGAGLATSYTVDKVCASYRQVL